MLGITYSCPVLLQCIYHITARPNPPRRGLVPRIQKTESRPRTPHGNIEGVVAFLDIKYLLSSSILPRVHHPQISQIVQLAHVRIQCVHFKKLSPRRKDQVENSGLFGPVISPVCTLAQWFYTTRTCFAVFEGH